MALVRSATQDLEKLLKSRLPAGIFESECMSDAFSNLSDSNISVHESDNEEGKRMKRFEEANEERKQDLKEACIKGRIKATEPLERRALAWRSELVSSSTSCS